MDKNLVKSSCLVQGVAGDGEEDVEESVVPAQRQQHEVEAVNTPAMLPPSLRVYRSVHHLSQGDIALHCITLYYIVLHFIHFIYIVLHFIHQVYHCITFYVYTRSYTLFLFIHQVKHCITFYIPGRTLSYILYTRYTLYYIKYTRKYWQGLLHYVASLIAIPPPTLFYIDLDYGLGLILGINSYLIPVFTG